MSNPCTVPVKPVDPFGDKLWESKHELHLLLAKESEPEVVFIGDTVFSFLDQSHIWRELFEPLHCLNFGVISEKIENTLWRIHNGVLDSIKPKVVVILSGTNNIKDSPEHIADGILEIVKQVQNKLPEAYIVLMELLPRGRYRNPLWDKFDAVNTLLKSHIPSLEHPTRVEFLSHDYSDLILNREPPKEGTFPSGDFSSRDFLEQISPGDFVDFLRLAESGVRKVFTPVYDIVCQLLGEDEGEMKE